MRNTLICKVLLLLIKVVVDVVVEVVIHAVDVVVFVVGAVGVNTWRWLRFIRVTNGMIWRLMKVEIVLMIRHLLQLYLNM